MQKVEKLLDNYFLYESCGYFKLLERKELPASTYSGKLVRRDMLQANSADAIFAIGTIGYNGYVNGGTAYATTRGILRGIPVYLFDQTDNRWKVWNTNANQFVTTDMPKLTPKACTVGTRKINKYGKQAIKDILSYTFNNDLFTNINDVSNSKLKVNTITALRNAEKDRIFGFNRDAEAIVNADVKETIHTELNYESETVLNSIKKGKKRAITVIKSDDNVKGWESIEVGSIVKITAENKSVFIRATTKPMVLQGSGLNPKKWAELNNSNIANFNNKIKDNLANAYQFEFEYIDLIAENIRYEDNNLIVNTPIQFDIADLNNPTQEELDNFANLTPAQKVYFVQTHFTDLGLFDALSVNLHNIKAIDGKKAGSQTIAYIEAELKESEEALKGYSVHPEHVKVANEKVRPFTKNRSCLDFFV